MLRKRFAIWINSPIAWLFSLSLVKFLIILCFYQNIICYQGDIPQICRSFGWNELVDNMSRGSYIAHCQTGLSDLYALTSQSIRPPIYPALLLAAISLGDMAAPILILFQSIITTLVAYLGYRLVLFATSNMFLSIGCMACLFFLPMNFLKSGVLDEAPLMVVFLLAAIYLIKKSFFKNNYKMIALVTGLLLGSATMTRYVAHPVALCLIGGSLLFGRGQRRLRFTIVMALVYILSLSPWLGRNYALYDKITLASGGNRFFLIAQSDDFIQSFPYESIDVIERRFLRQFHVGREYLSQLPEAALDTEFGRLAWVHFKQNPWAFIDSLKAKAKAFLPTGYFPTQYGAGFRELAFTIPYILSFSGFLFSLRRWHNIDYISGLLLISIISYAGIAFVYFLTSRHFYPLIVFMIIFSFASGFGIPWENSGKQIISGKET